MAGNPHKNGIWITPFGAGLAGVCFFLPWGKISCMGVRREFSGSSLGGVLWGVVILCSLIVLFFLLLRQTKLLRHLQPLSLVASAAALLLVLAKAVEAGARTRTGLGKILVSLAGMEIRIGGILFIAGLAACLAGASLCSWEKKRRKSRGKVSGSLRRKRY